MLKIENLHAEIDGKPILKGLSLTVNAGEVHAIMGPNGAGAASEERDPRKRKEGVMATQLYERDFYGWTQEQAAKLRRLAIERSNLDVDFEHLAEEIESVGGSDRKEVQNRLTTILEHMLKIAYSPAYEPLNGWAAPYERRDAIY